MSPAPRAGAAATAAPASSGAVSAARRSATGATSSRKFQRPEHRILGRISSLHQSSSAAVQPDVAAASQPLPTVDQTSPINEPHEDRRLPDDRRSGESDAVAADSSLRIDVVLLDKLMNLVGELVLAQSDSPVQRHADPTAASSGAKPAAEHDHVGVAGRGR